MTTTVKTKTIENGLIAVYTALKLNKREDGTNYRSVSDFHPDREVVLEIMHALHEDELPNDWRFDMAYYLASELLEYSEGQSEEWSVEDYLEFVPELAHNFSDDATSDLLEWAKLGSRIEFWDQPECAGELSITELLKARQKEEIAMMGYSLLSLVEDKLT